MLKSWLPPSYSTNKLKLLQQLCYASEFARNPILLDDGVGKLLRITEPGCT
ncbi:Hypothetical predicted protein [Mytilus galloprovincialis]|uniref:Uncharacterized protein n=1 Tax=Mytilus galloprovincialis TaxID=29158 RepID=A0A8B6FEQ3_MYTGA|nr:Hypothetical predicted protein [Mytilus galloprovincialis]